MANRKRSKIPPVPAFIDEDEAIIKSSHGRKDLLPKQNILDTPPPYTQEWLDANGLRVFYHHGIAELRFKT